MVEIPLSVNVKVTNINEIGDKGSSFEEIPKSISIVFFLTYQVSRNPTSRKKLGLDDCLPGSTRSL